MKQFSFAKVVLFLGIFILIADVQPPNQHPEAARGCSGNRSQPETPDNTTGPGTPAPVQEPSSSDS